MSTPPEKPVNSIDPFGHVSHETRERLGSEHHPIEGNSEPTRSPYAPTRARERTNAEHISQENDHDAVLSRYAPKKARTQPVQGPDMVTDDDVASLAAPRASERLRGHPERDGVAANEPYIASRDLEPDRWPQPGQRHEHSVSTRPDTGTRDLQRLEAALRTIQREDAAARIPRAAQLPPVSGLAAADAKARRHGIEMLELPRSLEPERMAPPPTMRTRRHRLRAPLMVLVASICSAPIGYYFWTGDWIPPSQPVPEPQMATLGSQTTAQSSARPQDLQQPVARGGDRGTLVQGEVFSQGPETSRQRGSSEGETVATLQPRSDQSPPANKVTRVLDPEEIKLLMKQGQQLIAAGDVVTARTVFQRAADAGDADAAIALGATYDPNVLAKLGVIGVRADVEKARNWYQRAEILGSPDARGRLDVLADH
jgi:hypothetical protein